jgi:hypothetical protein
MTMLADDDPNPNNYYAVFPITELATIMMTVHPETKVLTAEDLRGDVWKSKLVDVKAKANDFEKGADGNVFKAFFKGKRRCFSFPA